jgi:DNA-binding transcriptional ArsR family regulator
MVFDDVFAVIAEETRRDILLSLKSGDKAVGELVEELGASQPTISKHLRVLREASLVTMRAEGQRRYYSLNAGPLERISSWLAGLGLDGVGHQPAAGTVPAAMPALSTGTAGTAGTAPFLPGPPAGAAVSPPAEAVASAASARTASNLEPPRPAASQAPPGSVDGGRPQQLGRSVGRAANKAADLLANLPKFGRRRD